MKSCERKTFSLTKCSELNFYEPDHKTFKCINICRKAIDKGGLYPTIVNAANERAVELFLNGTIKFLDIEKCVLEAMKMRDFDNIISISSILQIDKKTRMFVDNYFNI